MNHDFFYREWNWIEQLSAAFHVFAANIKPILKVLLIVFLPISILESIINGRMLNAYTVFQQIAQAGVSLSNEADFFQAAYQVLFHSGLTLLVGLFLQPVGTIAIAKMVKQFVTKQEISFDCVFGDYLRCADFPDQFDYCARNLPERGLGVLCVCHWAE